MRNFFVGVQPERRVLWTSFPRPRAITYDPGICFVPRTHTPTLGCASPLQNLLSNLQAP